MRNLLILFVCTSCLWTSCGPDEEPTQNTWQKDEANPVLKRGEPYAYDFYVISDCWVLYHEGQYKMWYTGGGAVLPDETLRSRICYATSADGINWVKHAGNPVMDVSANAWDSLGVETASVIIDENAAPNQRYKMWYAGQTLNDYKYEIGYAYSADGITWNKHGTPVVLVGDANSWDNCFLEGPSVMKDGSIYKMWYAGYDCVVNGQSTDGQVNIGYATSSDGITWTRHENNPVLTATSNTWDKIYVQDPHVIKYNNAYHMWYGGADVSDNYFQQTGYAYSVDGIHWEKSEHNPVLKRGTAGQWDANTSSFPSVLIKDDNLHLWYTGKDVEPLPAWPAPYFWDLGYASKKLPVSERLD